MTDLGGKPARIIGAACPIECGWIMQGSSLFPKYPGGKGEALGGRAPEPCRVSRAPASGWMRRLVPRPAAIYIA